jgi:hypothetical protein
MIVKKEDPEVNPGWVLNVYWRFCNSMRENSGVWRDGKPVVLKIV